MAIKLEVFNLRGDVLSRITQGMNLYTSAKFRAFNINLNNVAPFSCTMVSFANLPSEPKLSPVT